MTFVRDEDIEALIAEIEKRPALYDKNLKDYSNVYVKKKLWEEICPIIVRNWPKLAPENKTRAVIDVQRKWQSLRNCFSRELRNQRKASSGLQSKKRRKYMYFDNLQFLMPTIEHRETNYDENTEDDENEHGDCDTMDSRRNEYRENTEVISMSSELPKDVPEFEQDLRKEYNEDLHFALSLVPTIASLSEAQKIEAKIQILSILKTLKFGPLCSETSSIPQTLDPKTNPENPQELDYFESIDSYDDDVKPSPSAVENANLYQRKWKSLRDSYSRERAKQKKESGSTAAKFRKKYKYFDQLRFLETGLKPTEDNNTLSDEEQIAIEDIKIEQDAIDPKPESDNFQDQRSAQQKRKRNEGQDEDFLETLRAKYCRQDEGNRVDDDDKLFLLSLHNDLKTLPDYIKLSVKSQIVGILSIAKQAVYPPKTLFQEFPSSSYQSPRYKENDTQQVQDSAHPSVLSPAEDISNSSNISNELFS